MSVGALNSGFPGMPGLSAALDRLNARQNALQGQLSSGVRAPDYAGLGPDAVTALSLQPQITAVAAWQANITAEQGVQQVTTTALTQISTIAGSLRTALSGLTSPSAAAVGAVATQARGWLDQLGSVLNTQAAGRYVFAGTASDQPPVPGDGALSDSPLAQAIAAQVAVVGTAGAAAVEGDTVALAASNQQGTTIFSAALSVPPADAAKLGRTLSVGANQTIPAGVVVTAGGAASATSTGSVIRDLVRVLASVAGLDQADSSSAGFADLVKNLGVDMGSIQDGLIGMQSAVGMTQQELDSRGDGLSSLGDALNSQLDTAKGVDPAAISTQLVATQTSLQESYSLIAQMKTLSLASFL
ncbi:flagellin [Rhizosaccharibacter radicis]|uniref:Flagellin n=1 Tax=Rhizosaccharibacter radicis TaxID=2782605 RepID=A0ABT1VSA7_9PROT|nr:flagellin [Acetobacteraceae bacterium KSS12]